jgi:hypothetical protein
MTKLLYESEDELKLKIFNKILRNFIMIPLGIVQAVCI